MKRSTKIIISILSMLILMALGIEMVSNNVIQIMSVEETNKELQEIVANAKNQPQLLTPSKSGYEPELDGITCGSLGGANTSAQYKYGKDTYCGAHGKQIARRTDIDGDDTTIVADMVGGGRAQKTDYEYLKTTEMAQSIAFAKAFGASDEEIQNLIWATNQWVPEYVDTCLDANSNETHYSVQSPGIYGRSYRFANFIYVALRDQEKDLGLQGAPLEGIDPRLNIMVDQDADTYTVGPYMIGFENQDKELVSGTEGGPEGKFGRKYWRFSL